MKSYVIITGAAGGVGKAFAQECASRGWDLLITDIREDKLKPLSEGLEREHNINVISMPCDLTDAEARENFWEQINRLGLKFHMLVNVAGGDLEGMFNERSPKELTMMIRLNIEATVLMTRQVLQYRDKTRVLRVINVSSLAGYYPMPVKAVYAASKRFILDFTLALNQEFPPLDATFTALCPAGMPTTSGAIQGIIAQGLMGEITTSNVGDVAARTINKALAGRSVYIPRFTNQLFKFFGTIVPPESVAKLIGKRWKKARKKNGDTEIKTEKSIASDVK